MSRRALLIGINYIGTAAELNGCINDVFNVRKYLINHQDYTKESITLLIENDTGYEPPTKWNILKHLITLRWKADPGDTLFIHYSGHGTQQPDKSGDEHDFIDETIVPLDYEINGVIDDDTIHKLFIYPMAADVNVLMVMDACHSGTVCDLKYTYDINNNEHNTEKMIKESNGNFVMISGCRDNQTSADAYFEEAREYQGALTNTFLSCIMALPGMTYKNLMISMRTILDDSGFTQVPQISSSKIINLDEKIKL